MHVTPRYAITLIFTSYLDYLHNALYFDCKLDTTFTPYVHCYMFPRGAFFLLSCATPLLQWHDLFVNYSVSITRTTLRYYLWTAHCLRHEAVHARVCCNLNWMRLSLLPLPISLMLHNYNIITSFFYHLRLALYSMGKPYHLSDSLLLAFAKLTAQLYTALP